VERLGMTRAKDKDGGEGGSRLGERGKMSSMIAGELEVVAMLLEGGDVEKYSQSGGVDKEV